MKRLIAKQGWIVYNGNLLDSKFVDAARWFDDAARGQGLDTLIIKNHHLLPFINNGHSSLAGPYASRRPDFVIFLDKDIRLAAHLEKMGIRVFNPSAAIAICDDKAMTYQVLSDHKIPMPRTILAPKVFDKVYDFSFCDWVIRELGFPMVIKEAFGSFGKQVYLVQNEEEIYERIINLGSSPYVFQELISCSYGRDVRLQVVGNRVVAAMQRESEHDFRANVSSGATMHRYQPSRQEEDLALACCHIIGLDFAGVDLLFGANGPLLCEVNSNAHISNLFDCSGVNAADAIISHIIDRLDA